MQTAHIGAPTFGNFIFNWKNVFLGCELVGLDDGYETLITRLSRVQLQVTRVSTDHCLPDSVPDVCALRDGAPNKQGTKTNDSKTLHGTCELLYI